MFQKVGLLDLLVGIWRRKLKIVLVAVVALLLAISVTAWDYVNREKEGDEVAAVYSKSAVYFVDTSEKSEGVDPVSQAQKVRNAYIALLDSEFCAEYLQKNVGQEAQLGEYFLPDTDSQSKKMNIPDENIDAIYKALKVETFQDTSALRLSFQCTDSELGDRVLDACYQYAVQESGKINPSTITEIGRSSYENVSEVTIPIGKRQFAKNVIKKAVVYGVILEFFYLLIAVFVMIFRPVINRKTDLQNYTDASVWEV